MPKLFRHGSMILYFWSNESKPTEPIHVHISYKTQTPDADKMAEEGERRILRAENGFDVT